MDSGNACGPDGRLPDASLDQKHLRDIFYRMASSTPEPSTKIPLCSTPPRRVLRMMTDQYV